MDFDDWFKQQFGKLPLTQDELAELQSEMIDAADEAEKFKAMYTAALDLSNRYAAALYAKNWLESNEL